MSLSQRQNKNHKILLQSARIRWTSIGEMNFSQSCVPCGTKLSTCSAMTMPPSHEARVLLNVVKKIDPPGCKKQFTHSYIICLKRNCFSDAMPTLSASVQAARNAALSVTCSSTSDTITASYFAELLSTCFSTTSLRYSIRCVNALFGG